MSDELDEKPKWYDSDKIYDCARCGIAYFTMRMWVEANRDGRDNFNCIDCKRTAQNYIQYFDQKGQGISSRCWVWRGEFDKDNNPIDGYGNTFTGEIALCGHKDCISKDHRPEMRNYAKTKLVTQVRRKLPQSVNFEKLWQAIESAAKV